MITSFLALCHPDCNTLLLLKRSWDCTELASDSYRQSLRHCRMVDSCSAVRDKSEDLLGMEQSRPSDKELQHLLGKVRRCLVLGKEHRQLQEMAL